MSPNMLCMEYEKDNSRYGHLLRWSTKIVKPHRPICPRTWVSIPTYMDTHTHVHGYAWPCTWVRMPEALGKDTQGSWAQMPIASGISGHYSLIYSTYWATTFLVNAWFLHASTLEFMILLCDLWYFYDTFCKINRKVSFFTNNYISRIYSDFNHE